MGIVSDQCKPPRDSEDSVPEVAANVGGWEAQTEGVAHLGTVPHQAKLTHKAIGDMRLTKEIPYRAKRQRVTQTISLISLWYSHNHNMKSHLQSTFSFHNKILWVDDCVCFRMKVEHGNLWGLDNFETSGLQGSQDQNYKGHFLSCFFMFFRCFIFINNTCNCQRPETMPSLSDQFPSARLQLSGSANILTLSKETVRKVASA